MFFFSGYSYLNQPIYIYTLYRVIQLTIATGKKHKSHYLLMDFKKKHRKQVYRLGQLLTEAM